jgi:hypothetical protein
VLTASEASKVKDIIGRLAAALSSGSGSSGAAAADGSNAAGSSAVGGRQGVAAAVPAAANITQLAAAIRDAVTWTQQSKSTVLGLIVQVCVGRGSADTLMQGKLGRKLFSTHAACPADTCSTNRAYIKQ